MTRPDPLLIEKLRHRGELTIGYALTDAHERGMSPFETEAHVRSVPCPFGPRPGVPARQLWWNLLAETFPTTGRRWKRRDGS